VTGMQPGEIRALRPEELALLAAIAAGQPVPPMTLKLPARRHGRADEEEDSDGETEAAPRPTKPPRFGTRAWRNAPAGGPSGGGREAAPRGAPGRGSGHSPNEGRRGLSPSGMARPGRTDFQRSPKQPSGHFKPRRFGSAAAGRPAPAGQASERRPPREPRGFRGERPEGFQRRPPRGGEGSAAPSGTARRGDFNSRPTARASYTGRAAEGRGGRRPPGAAQRPRGGRPEGAPFESRPGKPARGRGGWTPRPPGARPSFAAGSPRAPGERFAPRPPGGGGFRGKPASSRGGFKGRPPGAPSFERPSPGGRGAPPRGGPHGTRGGRPSGGGWGTKPHAAGGPGHGGGRPFSGRGGRGGRPEGRRGPPRPRGGAPRGPKR
jgi:translation initiation factor IF-2